MNQLLEQFARVVPFLGVVLPENYNVILLDTVSSGFPVVEQSNWIRQDVKQIRKILKTVLKNKAAVEQGHIMHQMILPNQSELSFISFFFIKDGEEVVGALCTDMDCSLLFKMNGFLSSMLPKQFNEEDPMAAGAVTINNGFTEAEILEHILGEYEEEPAKFTPQDRMEIIIELYDAGVFRMKGIIPQVAEGLAMSEQSVYRYLSKIKKMRS